MRKIKDDAQRPGAGLVAAEETQENPVGAETITAHDDKSDIVENVYRAEFSQQVKKQHRSDDQDHAQDQFGDQPLDFMYRGLEQCKQQLFFLFLGNLCRENDETDEQDQHQDPGGQSFSLHTALVY